MLFSIRKYLKKNEENDEPKTLKELEKMLNKMTLEEIHDYVQTHTLTPEQADVVGKRLIKETRKLRKDFHKKAKVLDRHHRERQQLIARLNTVNTNINPDKNNK